MAQSQFRIAVFEQDRLQVVLFLGSTPVGAARDYIAGQLGLPFEGQQARYRLLSGRAPTDQPDPGPTICACFEVGRKQIIRAIAAHDCDSAEKVGVATQAGTNCGSCCGEIERLISGRTASAVLT